MTDICFFVKIFGFGWFEILKDRFPPLLFSEFQWNVQKWQRHGSQFSAIQNIILSCQKLALTIQDCIFPDVTGKKNHAGAIYCS